MLSVLPYGSVLPMTDAAHAPRTRRCTVCHGTGTRLDPTCSDNVFTARDAITACRLCKGTGREVIPTPKAWTPPANDPAYDAPVGEIPDWML